MNEAGNGSSRQSTRNANHNCHIIDIPIEQLGRTIKRIDPTRQLAQIVLVHLDSLINGHHFVTIRAVRDVVPLLANQSHLRITRLQRQVNVGLTGGGVDVFNG